MRRITSRIITIVPSIRSFSTDNAIASAAAVKKLREISGAPLMDCKQALLSPAVQGDLQKAIDWLRAKGIAKATKGNRETKEGLIGIFHDSQRVTLVEVNCETDFVAMNQDFQRFVASVSETVHHHASSSQVFSAEEILHLKPFQRLSASLLNNTTAAVKDYPNLQEQLGDVISAIRENIVIKKAKTISSSSSQLLCSSYVHGKVNGIAASSPIQLGRSVGVLSFTANPTLPLFAETFPSSPTAKKLAMHLVASKPLFLSKKQVTEDFLAAERAIFSEGLSEADRMKPREILDKILQGKINKRLSEVCLLDQPHVAEEGNPVISKFLQLFGEKENLTLEISDFDLWSVK